MSLHPATESSSSRTARVRTVCIFFALAALVYWLPYFAPLKPTNSYSYVFGYNNRLALLLVVSLAGIAALWTRGRLAPIAVASRDTTAVPRKDLAWAIGATLLVCLVMIALFGRLGGYLESGYDIYRLYLVSLGKRPYRDFEWPFGVALLYVPLWTSGLLKISQQAAFYVVWTIASLLSSAALYAIVNRLRYVSGHARRWIFWLLFIVSLGLPLNLGLHYAGIRYLIPILSVLIVADWCRPARRRVAAAVVLLLGTTATMLVISPEAAVAVFVSGAVLVWPRNRFTFSVFSWTAYAGAMAGMAALFLLADRFGVFNTVRASGAGADSLPLMPSAGSLLFLVNVAIGFSILVWRWRHPDPEDNAAVLIVEAIPLLPAALGRADPGHLYWNGLGFVIAAMVYLWPHRARWAWGGLWGVSYVLPLMVSLPMTFATGFGFTAMAAQSGEHQASWQARAADWMLERMPEGSLRRKAAVRFENAKRYPIRTRYDFARIYPGVPVDWDHVVMDAPFGFDPSHSFAMYRSAQVDFGFYEGDENANTPAAVQRKIAELAAHPERPVLMPGHAEDGAPPIDYRAKQHELTLIADFPYRAHPKHLEPIYAPLYDYLRVHYELAAAATPADYSYELWLPKQDGGIEHLHGAE